mmetsp:Transcript_19981/g.43552  ORF Transcript_19981/g.43552 Transcript_19981/m.43552 type:complete len:274 (+) Transcript_19981:2188-3009(+)
MRPAPPAWPGSSCRPASLPARVPGPVSHRAPGAQSPSCRRRPTTCNGTAAPAGGAAGAGPAPAWSAQSGPHGCCRGAGDSRSPSRQTRSLLPRRPPQRRSAGPPPAPRGPCTSVSPRTGSSPPWRLRGAAAPGCGGLRPPCCLVSPQPRLLPARLPPSQCLYQRGRPDGHPSLVPGHHAACRYHWKVHPYCLPCRQHDQCRDSCGAQSSQSCCGGPWTLLPLLPLLLLPLLLPGSLALVGRAGWRSWRVVGCCRCWCGRPCVEGAGPSQSHRA